MSRRYQCWLVSVSLAIALVGCDDNKIQSDPDDTSTNPDDTSSNPIDSASDAVEDGGDTTEPDMSVELCGNLMCDSGEACNTCEIDCGRCDEPVITECNDGVDNDGDGLVDWAFDLGCYASGDATEAAGPRTEENGWSTFDPEPESVIIYVSSSQGDDDNDGLTPETAVATPRRGAELIRDGEYDFLLFRRGDAWRGLTVGDDRVQRRFKSGRDAEHPLVVASYGDSTERPRFELDTHFIDDDGHDRSFIAVLGLQMVSYPKVPDDPAFNGADGGALRFVGTGGNILMEDLDLVYGEFIVQNVRDVEVRRNIVYRSYHVGTCAYNADGSRNPNGDNTFRPSGIFAGSVDGLLIEGNVWDQNGWNPDVPEACATIYNHDLYLSGNDRLTVRDNLILRASSIGLKMAANTTGASGEITIEHNLFAEGEIGISMGGNSNDPDRFLDAAVLDNVFTDIGRAQPTTRELTWYLDLADNVRSEVRGNLMVNQPPLANPHGIQINGGTQTDITIRENALYGMGRRAIVVEASGAWSNISIADNALSTDRDDACLVSHSGGFGAVTYSGNTYDSAGPSSEWFCVDGNRSALDGWISASSESGATASTPTLPDAGRNVDGYAAHLGIGTTLEDFAAAARNQSRLTWRPELSARAVSNWIREGYGLPPK